MLLLTICVPQVLSQANKFGLAALFLEEYEGWWRINSVIYLSQYVQSSFRGSCFLQLLGVQGSLHRKAENAL